MNHTKPLKFTDIKTGRVVQRHGYREMKADWLGMHNPYGGTRLFLVADSTRGVPLDPLIEVLNRLPAPPPPRIGGESARSPYFVGRDGREGQGRAGKEGKGTSTSQANGD